MVAGALAFLNLPNGFQKAHGVGLDGKTPVKSLSTAISPDLPGQHLVQDTSGNVIHGTADELFVAAQAVAQKAGYRLTATKV